MDERSTAILRLLLRNPGAMVTREEIQRQILPAGTDADFEQSLDSCIRQICEALGDGAPDTRLIERVPSGGYRWAGGPEVGLGRGATILPWPGLHALGSTEADESGDARSGGSRPPSERASVGRRLPNGWRFLVVAAAAGVLGGFGVWAWLSVPEATVPVFQRLTFHRGFVTSARFCPTGRVVYGAAWEGRPLHLYLTSCRARDNRALELPGGRIVATSAHEVAYIGGGVLSRAPLASGPPRSMLTGVIAADWTPDASVLAVVRARDAVLHLEYPVGHLLAKVNGRVSQLRLSPDGTRVALAEHPMPGDDRGHVVVYDGEGRRLASSPEWSSLGGLAWSPGGEEVWFSAAEVGADADLRALSLDGRVRTLLSALGRMVLHDTDPDGRVLLERSTLSWETYFQRAGEAKERDLTWLDVTGVQDLSDDGGLALLVESGDGAGPEYTSFLRHTDGSPPMRLGPGNATGLSPDGRWVTMIPVRRPDHVAIVPTGEGERRRIEVPRDATYQWAGWLPDGRRLHVTTQDESGGWTTWLVDAWGDEARPLLPGVGAFYSICFSPDGERFVARCVDDPASACVHDTEWGVSRPLPGAQAGWGPVAWDEEDRLYFYENTGVGTPAVLWRVGLKDGLVERLAEVGPSDWTGVLGISRLVVARSGDAWAYSLGRQLSDLFIVTGIE